MTGAVVVRSLAECEEVIEHGLETFYDVGRALAEIRDEDHYKTAGYSNFETYCRERWDFNDRRASQFILAAEVSTIVEGSPPKSESVARELAPLREQPEKLREAWTEAVEVSNGKPTAKDVRAVVEQYRDAPAATDTTPVPPYTTCPTCGHRVRADKPLRPRKEST